MQGRIFYIGTLVFILAVALGTAVFIPPAYFLLLLLLSLALGLVAYLKRSSPSHLPVILVAVGLLFAGAGLWRAYVAVEQYANSPLHNEVGNKIVFEGLVVREPDERAKNIQLTVQMIDTDELILVSVDRYSDVSYGDIVSVVGKLETPEAFVTDYGRTFLYPEYLKAKGIQFRISFAQIEVVSSNKGNMMLSGLFAFKQAFVDKLGLVLSEPQSGLGIGLLLGVKRALGEELEEAFRRTGIIHIVVLSGYNIMLVVAFVLFILGTFLPFVARAVFGIGAIVLFALLVGLSPTVLRASIMASLVLLAPLLGRQYDLMRALLLAGAVMILVNPYILLYDVGFQLSFLATLGLILVAPQFELLLLRAPNTFKVREFFIATLATQVAVAPLLLYQIGELSLIALLVNVLVLPMVGVAMLLTFITGMLAFVSVPLAGVVAMPAYLSLSYIIECARWFAHVPYATVVAPPFPLALMVAVYGVMIITWYLVVGRRRKDKQLLPAMKISTSETDGKVIPDWEVVVEETLASDASKKEAGSRDEKSVVSKENLNTKEVPIFFR